MENTFGLTDEQVAFILTHYQSLTVSEMRTRLHVGAEKVNKFLDVRGLVPRQVQQSRRTFEGRPREGFFNVDLERNWLVDDGDGQPYESPTLRRIKYRTNVSTE